MLLIGSGGNAYVLVLIIFVVVALVLREWDVERDIQIPIFVVLFFVMALTNLIPSTFAVIVIIVVALAFANKIYTQSSSEQGG